MGHRQDMTLEQRLQWDSDNYRKRLEAKKGSNYEYWNDERHEKLLKNGWELFQFTEKASRQWNKIFTSYTTSSEHHAKKAVKKLREENNFARIICGYEQNIQRIKMYSVIFKSKKINKYATKSK